MFNKLKKEILWVLTKGIVAFLERLSWRKGVFAGRIIGDIAYKITTKDAKQAEKRCAVVLSVSESEASRIVRESYRNLGRSLAEFVMQSKVGFDLIKKVVEVEGLNFLESAFRRQKGVILLTAHLGNWELAAAYISFLGYPMNAIGAEQRDDRFTELIMDLRLKCGVKTIPVSAGLKKAIECLRKGEILGVLLDQDMGKNTVKGKFLGYEAITPYAPIKIAIKMGVPVVPLFIIRDKNIDYRHKLYFLKPIYFDKEDDLVNSVQLCNDILSEWIRRYPEQWLWLHDRWETTRSVV